MPVQVCPPPLPTTCVCVGGSLRLGRGTRLTRQHQPAPKCHLEHHFQVSILGLTLPPAPRTMLHIFHHRKGFKNKTKLFCFYKRIDYFLEF